VSGCSAPEIQRRIFALRRLIFQIAAKIIKTISLKVIFPAKQNKILKLLVLFARLQIARVEFYRKRRLNFAVCDFATNMDTQIAIAVAYSFHLAVLRAL